MENLSHSPIRTSDFVDLSNIENRPDRYREYNRLRSLRSLRSLRYLMDTGHFHAQYIPPREPYIPFTTEEIEQLVREHKSIQKFDWKKEGF